MIHLIKYILLTLFLFAVLNLFHSNIDLNVQLHFKIPYILDLAFKPIAFNYFVILAFSMGILFAGVTGAFRFDDLRALKKENKELKNQLEKHRALDAGQKVHTAKTDGDLPPLVG